MKANNVLNRESVDSECIKSLISGESLALRIPNFISKDTCNFVAKKILERQDKGNYNKAEEIGRIGLAHFEIDNADKFNEYHDNAVKNTLRLRNIFEPYLSPVDKLRLILDEIWAPGASIEILYGRKCFVGICRIIDPSIELLAHNDRLDRDSPDSYQAISLLGQLSANIFIQVPNIGGGLRIWSKQPESEIDYQKLKSGSYGIKLEALGKPSVIIQPEQGDLIIFNTRNYHGVAAGSGGARINVGMFIGYRGEAAPLTYWS
jgi:hypothetical protein